MLNGISSECKNKFLIFGRVLLEDGLETFGGRINDAVLLVIIVFINNT